MGKGIQDKVDKTINPKDQLQASPDSSIDKVKTTEIDNTTKPKEQISDLDHLRHFFIKRVSEGPDFVCGSCHRLKFKTQVRRFYKENYCLHDLVYTRAIDDKYLHVCDNQCTNPCNNAQGPRGELYMCTTRHSHLKNNKLAPECSANGLKLFGIPNELTRLNTLERYLTRTTHSLNEDFNIT